MKRRDSRAASSGGVNRRAASRALTPSVRPRTAASHHSASHGGRGTARRPSTGTASSSAIRRIKQLPPRPPTAAEKGSARRPGRTASPDWPRKATGRTRRSNHDAGSLGTRDTAVGSARPSTAGSFRSNASAHGRAGSQCKASPDEPLASSRVQSAGVASPRRPSTSAPSRRSSDNSKAGESVGKQSGRSVAASSVRRSTARSREWDDGAANSGGASGSGSEMSSEEDDTSGVVYTTTSESRPSSRCGSVPGAGGAEAARLYGDGLAKSAKVRQIVTSVVSALQSKFGMAGSMRKVFRQWDEDGNGTIDRDEFFKVLWTSGINISGPEADLVFRRFDLNGNSVLDVSEMSDYVFAQYMSPLEISKSQRRLKQRRTSLEMKKLRDDNEISRLVDQVGKVLRPKYELRKLRQVFREWDTDFDGSVSREEFAAVLENNGVRLSKQEVAKLHRRFDVHDEDALDYEEFSNVIFGNFDAAQEVHEKAGEAEVDLLRQQARRLGVSAAGSNKVYSHVDVDSVLITLRKRYGDKGLRSVFRAWDTNKDGVVSPEELDQALNIIGIRVSPDLVMELINSCDQNSDGNIQYDDFVCMVYGSDEFLDELHHADRRASDLTEEEKLFAKEVRQRVDALTSKLGTVKTAERVSGLRTKLTAKLSSETVSLREMFRTFDVNSDGMVSYDEYRTVLQALGLGLSKDDVELMMVSADGDGGGSIDYVELARMLAASQDKTIIDGLSKRGAAHVGRLEAKAHLEHSGDGSKFGLHPPERSDGRYSGLEGASAFRWAGQVFGTAPHARPVSGRDMARTLVGSDGNGSLSAAVSATTIGRGIVSDSMAVGLAGVQGVVVRGNAGRSGGHSSVGDMLRGDLLQKMRLLEPQAREAPHVRHTRQRPRSAPPRRPRKVSQQPINTRVRTTAKASSPRRRAQVGDDTLDNEISPRRRKRKGKGDMTNRKEVPTFGSVTLREATTMTTADLMRTRNERAIRANPEMTSDMPGLSPRTTGRIKAEETIQAAARRPAAGGGFIGVGNGNSTWAGGTLAGATVDRMVPEKQTAEAVKQRTRAFGCAVADTSRSSWLHANTMRHNTHADSSGHGRFSHTPYTDTQNLIAPPAASMKASPSPMGITARERFKTTTQVYGSGEIHDKVRRERAKAQEEARFMRVRANESRVHLAHETVREKDVIDHERRVKSIIGQRLAYFQLLEPRLQLDRAAQAMGI